MSTDYLLGKKHFGETHACLIDGGLDKRSMAMTQVRSWPTLTNTKTRNSVPKGHHLDHESYSNLNILAMG